MPKKSDTAEDRMTNAAKWVIAAILVAGATALYVGYQAIAAIVRLVSPAIQHLVS